MPGTTRAGRAIRAGTRPRRRVDDHLREIAATLDFGRDTLLVVSDHGQIDRGGHGGQDPIALVEPFVLVGAGVKPGSYGDVNQVDVAPTLAVLLGANIPATAQGRVRTEMLALTARSDDDHRHRRRRRNSKRSWLRRMVQP